MERSKKNSRALKKILSKAKKYQKRAAKFAAKAEYAILAMDMGLGKMSRNSSPVYTPKGPIPMGMIRKGDMVLGMDGSPKKVLAVYPQGVKDIYRVTMNDGTYTDVGLEHLWSVRTSNQKYRGTEWRVKTTKELIGDLSSSCGGYKWEIPVISYPAYHESQRIPINPYILGLLLGDGSLTSGQVALHNSSEGIVEEFKSYFNDKYGSVSTITSARNGDGAKRTAVRGMASKELKGDLNDLGLLGRKSHSKFIPKEYLYNSVEVRVALLQGLLDTDGSPCGPFVEYSTVSTQLALDITELVNGLGGTCKVTYRMSTCQTGVFPSYRIHIKLPKGIEPFRLARKKDKYFPPSKYEVQRRIASIELVDREEATCITVEGEHYLTDNYIVTHNTFTSMLAWQMNGGGKLLVVAPASLVLNWKLEIQKWFGDIYTVATFFEGKEVHVPWDSHIAIVSYDLGTKCPELIEWCDTMIIDEVQEIKTMDIERTKFYHKNIYEYSVPNLYLLSGTPIQNGVREFYSLLCLMHYKEGHKSDFLDKFEVQEDFSDHFSWREDRSIYVGGQRRNITTWSGFVPENVAELKKYLKPFYHRVKFGDVESLPPIVFKEILLSERDDLQLLKDFKKYKDFYDDEENQKMNIKSKVRSAVHTVPFTIKYAKDLIAQGLPVLVFTDHKESCHLIAEALGVTPITSDVSPKRRGQIAASFQRGEEDSLVATIGTMGTGHNLMRAADIVINDENWSAGKMSQVFGRIQRIGQDKLCTVHTMLGSPQALYISRKQADKRRTIAAVT